MQTGRVGMPNPIARDEAGLHSLCISLLTGSAVRFTEATFTWEHDGNAVIRE